MIKKKKNSKSGTPHPSREPAESVSQKLQPLSISKSECPLGCAFGQAHSSAISTHTHAQTQTQTRPCLCPCPCTQPPRHSKMFAQHNYRFGGLWEKYTSYELWDTRYNMGGEEGGNNGSHRASPTSTACRKCIKRNEYKWNKEWTPSWRVHGAFDLIDDGVQAPDVDAMRRWMWIAPLPMLIDKWNV